MRTKWVPEVVELDDVPKRMHPTFQAAIDKLSYPGNVIGPDFPFCRIPLFALATEKDDIQFHKVQIFERLFRSGRAELVEPRIKSLQMRLE